VLAAVVDAPGAHAVHFAPTTFGAPGAHALSAFVVHVLPVDVGAMIDRPPGLYGRKTETLANGTVRYSFNIVDQCNFVVPVYLVIKVRSRRS
jgi:hypothetical protein